MTTATDVATALALLERLGLSPQDLLSATPTSEPEPVPTFDQYVPSVAGAVSPGTLKVYGPYWNRLVQRWGHRPINDPTPTQIQQLVEQVRQVARRRRNSKGGRSAAEHMVAALRCLYRHAVADGLIDAADNPAAKVAKPRRLPSTRRAVAANHLAEINDIAARTGNDPALDTLILRLHEETACRRGGALALRPCDLDPFGDIPSHPGESVAQTGPDVPMRFPPQWHQQFRHSRHHRARRAARRRG